MSVQTQVMARRIQKEIDRAAARGERLAPADAARIVAERPGAIAENPQALAREARALVAAERAQGRELNTAAAVKLVLAGERAA